MKIENQVGPIHYRIREYLEPEGVFIRAETFKSVKETPHGFWVVSQYAPTWLSADELRKRKFAKWVSKDSRKRHCYPDINDALKSFKRRKEVQVSRLRLQLEQAELAVETFANYESATIEELKASINIGEIPSAYGLIWEI